MSEERRHDAIAIALLLLIEAALFADVIAGSGVFFFRDFSRYYFPVKKMQREIVLAGEFPWWTRAYGAGQPLAANPEHETFYPLNWLILLPDYLSGLHLQTLLHIAIGLVGMYAFLRSLQLRAFPSFIGALSFGLGGPTLSKINMSPFLFSIVWMPLTCLFARKFLIGGSRRSFVFAVMCLGMQLLIGEPTTILQTMMIIGGYALWLAHQSKVAAPVWRAAAIGIGGLLLGAVQIVPAMDFMRDSARARPFQFEIVTQWSMPWAKLIELVFPNVLGHQFVGETTAVWGAHLYYLTAIPFLLSIYPGLLISALAIAGLASRRRGALVVALICIGATLLAAGRHFPLMRALYDVGLVRTLRYPEKFIVIAVFALTVFAAYCIDALQAGDGRLRRAARAVAIVLTAIPLALFIWSSTPGYTFLFARVFNLDAATAAIVSPMSRFDWLVATIQGAALLALTLTARKAERPVWMLAATATMLIDFARLTPEIAPRMPRRLYDRPQIPPAVADSRFRLFHHAALNFPLGYSGRIPTQRGFPTPPAGVRFRHVAALQYGYRNGLFPLLPAAWGIPTVIEADVDATDLLPTIDFTHAVEMAAAAGGERAVAAAMAMSNARFRAVYKTVPSDANVDPELLRPVAFIETTRQPRYYFGSPVLPFRGLEDFALKIANVRYPPSVAFVAEPLDVTGTGVVQRVVETSNSATIDVVADGRALLVMSVTPHRYWQIHVDGNAVRPVVTNVGYQGIVVPPGQHRVTMRYRNPVVIASGIVSALAAVTLMGVAFTGRRSVMASTRNPST